MAISNNNVTVYVNDEIFNHHWLSLNQVSSDMYGTPTISYEVEFYVTEELIEKYNIIRDKIKYNTNNAAGTYALPCYVLATLTG